MSQPIMPNLVRQLKSVSDPSLFPDGSRLAYTLSWVDGDEWKARSRIMGPGATLLRVATKFVSAGDVAGKAPEFGTTCEIGNPMNYSMARRSVSVYVASNGKAGWIDT